MSEFQVYLMFVLFLTIFFNTCSILNILKKKEITQKKCIHDFKLYFTCYQDRIWQYKCTHCEEIICISMDD